MRLYDHDVHVSLTGLYVHQQYPFLAALPDCIVQEYSETGFSGVKCPTSMKGKMPEEACATATFCCKLDSDHGISLKKFQEYYYQVQEAMAITGMK